MDGRLLAGVFGLLIAGCAHALSALPETAPYDVSPRAESLTPIDPGPKGQVDPAARKVSTAPSLPDLPPDVAARPAPFADRAGSARIQAPPASGRDDLPSAERPAPFADQVPTAARPQAPTPSRTLPAPATAPSSTPAEPKTDPSVSQTAGENAGVRAPANADSGRQAAKVGNEVITLLQLRNAVKNDMESVPPEQRNDPQIQRMFIDRSLLQLIERSLLVQAAKKQMKDPKVIDSFYAAIDKAWLESELPPLLREHKVTNIHQLKVKMAEQGKSLDQIRDDFRQTNLAREYMMMKLQPKLTVSLPEKIKYYNAHTKEYDRPAQVVWREIVVDAAKSKSREEARARAVAIAARLKAGADFAKVAKAESHGATARDGGVWEIAPGGYAIPQVNDVLVKLPIDTVSGVIEAPAGFHIVRVDSRRDAGPARFDEVQDQVKEAVYRDKVIKLTGAFLDDLRSRTIITTMFDSPTSDPSAIRTGASSTPAR